MDENRIIAYMLFSVLSLLVSRTKLGLGFGSLDLPSHPPKVVLLTLQLSSAFSIVPLSTRSERGRRDLDGEVSMKGCV